MFKQVYKAGEIVYDVGEKNCDCLYFVFEGKLRVEAEVSITKQLCVPVSTHEWEKSTKTYLVSYLVRELGR